MGQKTKMSLAQVKTSSQYHRNNFSYHIGGLHFRIELLFIRCRLDLSDASDWTANTQHLTSFVRAPFNTSRSCYNHNKILNWWHLFSHLVRGEQHVAVKPAMTDTCLWEILHGPTCTNTQCAIYTLTAWHVAVLKGRLQGEMTQVCVCVCACMSCRGNASRATSAEVSKGEWWLN